VVVVFLQQPLTLWGVKASPVGAAERLVQLSPPETEGLAGAAGPLAVLTVNPVMVAHLAVAAALRLQLVVLLMEVLWLAVALGVARVVVTLVAPQPFGFFTKEIML
jgi:hypothetical protein